MNFNLTFGADPEIFAGYSKKGKVYVEPPVIFRTELGVNADLSNPKHPVFLEKEGITLMEDGAAFEFTIPPTKKADEMFKNIQLGINMLKEIISSLDSNYFTWARPVINFDISRFNLEKCGRDIWGCMIFGCDPDLDAMDLGYKSDILDVSTHEFRYGGGHFHIGSESSEEINLIHTNPLPFIRLLAVTVGNLVIAKSIFPKEERQRAFHYGKPGRYRIQKWGIEYRAPSNSWISNIETTEEMFNAVEFAFYLLNNPKEGKQILKKYLYPTIDAISKADCKTSESIVKKLELI